MTDQSEPLLTQEWYFFLTAELEIRIRMFLDLPDPDPLVRGMDADPDPVPDPSLFSSSCWADEDWSNASIIKFLYKILAKLDFKSEDAVRL